MLIDLKGIGGHSTRIPAEADMIFILILIMKLEKI